jgi:Protein of unknown function (DUF998)
VLFTLAWVAGSLRQAGHSAAELQLSGLAAEDARDPQIMMAGFVLLGAGTVVLGAGLGRVTAPRPAGRWLVLVPGAASIAAGLFRRDHMLLDGPGFAGESWHNQVHDVVSGVAYGAMLAAPLVLARRWRDDPGWGPVGRPVQGSRAGQRRGPGGLRVPDCRAVQRRSAADRGHACAGRRDPHRRADAHPAGNRFRCRARRHTRPGSAG